MSRTKHPDLDRRKGLYLKRVPRKGRGVFCRTAIRKGETLEVTPAVVLNDRATTHADKTMLQNYTFVVGDISAQQRKRAGMKKKSEEASSVVFGILTFCNHDEEPNAEILWEEHGDTLYYILKATRDIPKNTEICTTYGPGWFADRNMKK